MDLPARDADHGHRWGVVRTPAWWPRMSERAAILNVVLVAVGGAIGASMRHACFLVTEGLGWGEAAGLLLVNLPGSFALGFIVARLDPEAPRSIDTKRSLGQLDPDPSRDRIGAFMAVGLIGAFTTYSSLAVLLAEGIRTGDPSEGIAMIAVSLAGGLAMVGSGFKVGRRRWERAA